MDNFIFLVLKGAVGVAKRSTHGNRKLSFDYAVQCIVEEMKRRNRYDLYMQARRVLFISRQRKTANEVVEYFGYKWSDVVSRETIPPACNTGVTPPEHRQSQLAAVEEYINGSN